MLLKCSIYYIEIMLNIKCHRCLQITIFENFTDISVIIADKSTTVCHPVLVCVTCGLPAKKH